MLSRVAENIFWMSRYMERTNFQLKVFHTRYIAYQDGASVESWENFCEENQIEIDNDELESYQIKLKQLLDEVKKIDTLNDIYTRASQEAVTAKKLRPTIHRNADGNTF